MQAATTADDLFMNYPKVIDAVEQIHASCHKLCLAAVKSGMTAQDADAFMAGQLFGSLLTMFVKSGKSKETILILVGDMYDVIKFDISPEELTGDKKGS